MSDLVNNWASISVSILCSYAVVRYLKKAREKIQPTNRNSSKPIVISVDGNIGSGKSTLIKILKEKYGDSIYFAAEPVDAWSQMIDGDGNNLLHNFYTDKNRWSYSFQNIAYITRAKELQKALESGKRVIITERSVMTDRNLFAKMLFNDGFMNKMEMAMYDTWFGLFNTNIDYTFYVKTTVDNCVDRIKKRGRDGEGDIDRNYLEALENAHEEWLAGDDDWCKLPSDSEDTNEPGKIVVLDGNPEDHIERLTTIRDIIDTYIY